MNISLPQSPRFLPTLTEVIDPSTLGLVPATAQPEGEQLVRLVMQRVHAELERRVREQAQALVQEHLQAMRASINDQIEPLVRQVVAEALPPLTGQETMK